MGIAAHRKRGTFRDARGGGLIEPSLTDDVSVAEHETGDSEGLRLTDVEIDYDNDDEYVEVGTVSDDPPADSYTLTEALDDMGRYVDKPYERSTVVRDTAQIWGCGTITIPAGMSDVMSLLGADPRRKSVKIWNWGVSNTVKTQDVYLGPSAGVSARGGSNSFLLKANSGANDRTYNYVEMNHTGDIFLIRAQYDTVTPQETTISFIEERYA